MFIRFASCHQHLLFHDRLIEIAIRIDFADFKYVNLLGICLAPCIGAEEIDVLQMIFFRERSYQCGDRLQREMFLSLII